MSTESKYINGVFINKKEGQFGEYFTAGLTDEGLKALANLPKNEKGIRNFIFSAQREDPTKFSAKPVLLNKKTDAVQTEATTDNLPF